LQAYLSFLYICDMRFLLFFICIVFFLNAKIASAQLLLTKAPIEGAFLARNLKTNSAIVPIQGKVTDPSISSFYIRIYQSGVLIHTRKVPFKFINGEAEINQWLSLPSGKYIYKINFELIGSSTISYSINNIIVGDVYLIQGQSNAVAASYQAFDKSFYDTFCLSFGSSSTNGAVVESDTNWYPTNADNYYSKGTVGQWGAVMAKLLVDSFSIPICLLNGAVGGTRITQHQMDQSNPENLSTIYGRLLYRVRKAKYENNIRGIIYFQGESDGTLATQHDTLFQKLHQSWLHDYPGFEKLYVIQVRSGCGNPSIQLRDVQRRFEDSLVNCKSVSANGLNGHDGCHYRFDLGYKQMGVQMAALIGRDYYGSKRKNIDPPHIKSCHFSNSTKTEITLEMRNSSDDLYIDTLFHQLFGIEGDPGVTITKGELINNKIVLQLSQSSCKIIGLTYDGLPYKRAWVKNSLDMGLISFYNVPIIQLSPTKSNTACKNTTVTLSAPFIDGCTYTWKRIATNVISQGRELKIVATKDEEFTLFINYDKSVCKQKDTFEVRLYTDSINIPVLGPDRTICFGKNWRFEPDTFGFDHFLWQGARAPLNSFDYLSDTTETIGLIAQSRAGCTYKDECQVFLSIPKVILPDDTIVCPNEKILVSITDTFSNYYWNDKIGNDSFYAESGLLVLRVIDRQNCEASDTMKIDNYEVASKIEVPNALCFGTTSIIYKKEYINSWFKDSDTIGDSLVLSSPSTFLLHIIDLNYCSTFDSFHIKAMPLPVFELGKDSGLCSNTELLIQLPQGSYKYYWNNKMVLSPEILIIEAGSYSAIIVDTNACYYGDSINFIPYASPSLDQFFDSILCENEKWMLPLNPALLYTINGQSVFNSVTFQSEGTYRIYATNKYNCASKKNIDIRFKKCELLTPFFTINPLQIYPNPSLGLVIIVNSSHKMLAGELFSINGEFVRSIDLSPGENILNLKNQKASIYQLRIDSSVYRIVKMD
jgi:hypothetical protein